MRFRPGARLLVGLCCAAVLAFALGRASARVRGGSPIVGVFGVGGVLVENGGLWQYLPDEKKWMTIDEAFRRDGRETHVLPLPVPAKVIRSMESWGFLVTQSGDVWHYDLETNRWQNIGAP
jgi:hypothetical protein